MNPTTNPQQPQVPSPQAPKDPTKGANQAAASLAFATHLQNQLIQHQAPPQTEQNPQSGQESPAEEKPEDDKVTKLEQKMGDFEKKMEDMVSKKFDDFKQLIQDALAEDDTEDTKKDKPNEEPKA